MLIIKIAFFHVGLSLIQRPNQLYYSYIEGRCRADQDPRKNGPEGIKRKNRKQTKKQESYGTN